MSSKRILVRRDSLKYPQDRMATSKYSTHPIRDVKTKTITLSLPVRVYYETEVDYDDFMNQYCDQDDGEADDDFQLRCVRTWATMLKALGETHELSEIDHEGEAVENGDALDLYGDAKDEFVDEVARAVKHVKEQMKKEKPVEDVKKAWRTHNLVALALERYDDVITAPDEVGLRWEDLVVPTHLTSLLAQKRTKEVVPTILDG